MAPGCQSVGHNQRGRSRESEPVAESSTLPSIPVPPSPHSLILSPELPLCPCRGFSPLCLILAPFLREDPAVGRFCCRRFLLRYVLAPGGSCRWTFPLLATFAAGRSYSLGFGRVWLSSLHPRPVTWGCTWSCLELLAFLEVLEWKTAAR